MNTHIVQGEDFDHIYNDLMLYIRSHITKNFILVLVIDKIGMVLSDNTARIIQSETGAEIKCLFGFLRCHRFYRLHMGTNNV